jgi:hypothetical protein
MKAAYRVEQMPGGVTFLSIPFGEAQWMGCGLLTQIYFNTIPRLIFVVDIMPHELVIVDAPSKVQKLVKAEISHVLETAYAAGR